MFTLCSINHSIILDLPQEAHGIHLSSIQVTLKTTIDDPVVSNNPHVMYAVWMTMVKFLQWYLAAVYTLIRGDSGGERCATVDACLGLIIWFHHPLSFGNCASDVKVCIDYRKGDSCD